MKLVFKSNDINEANDVKFNLEKKGIPSMVSENDMRNRGTHIPEGNAVMIYVNTQYTDALNLIENPNHVVTEPIDVNEFYEQFNNESAKNAVSKTNQFIKFTLVLFAIVIVTFMFLLNK